LTRTACITLDLEPDYAGRVPTAYAGWAPQRIDALMAMLRAREVPLTVFVVARCLEDQPEAVDRFRRAGAEFHLHSFSHDLARPDSEDEISRGRAAFERYFGAPPQGYRAPEGRISPAGLARLEAEGFAFDSSVFPSFWPHPSYLRFPRVPFRPDGRKVLELPISTVSPLRLIVSLSWMRLLGWGAYRALLERGSLPEPLVFDMHLHDLWTSPSYARLGWPWSWIYRRNPDAGVRFLERFLDLLAARGYRFTTLGAVARALQTEGAAC
jgi:peptidoglycan/xylan/chitin deacetylase (PgdA/CDA1 family)